MFLLNWLSPSARPLALSDFMPIRINLLAEAQAAEEMRRKDPVKRAVWIGGFVVFVVLLCAATLQCKIMAARSEVNTFEVSWKRIESKVKEINDHRNNTRDLEQKLSALDQFTTNRLLWAAALNALQYVSVDGVQVMRLRAEQTFSVNEGGKARTPDAGGAAAGRPATVTEHVVLSVEGRDYSAQPGEHVPTLKQSLVNYPYFQENLQKTNKVQLTSQTAPQGEANRQFVSFGLQLFFQDKERRLYE